MEQISKSLSALDRAFAKLGKKGLEAIIAKIDSMDIQGPTIEEYFSDFETYYEHLFENVCELAASTMDGNTYNVKTVPPPKNDIVVSLSDIQWYDPENKNLNQNKSTTVQNNGGFLFSLQHGRTTTSKICFSRLCFY